jgi:hypothetical protein
MGADARRTSGPVRSCGFRSGCRVVVMGFGIRAAAVAWPPVAPRPAVRSGSRGWSANCQWASHTGVLIANLPSRCTRALRRFADERRIGSGDAGG